MATRGIEAGESTRALARQYSEVRATTVRLAAPLSAEDQMLQSMPEASPAKWHLAHTTWFFETFLLTPHARNYRPFDGRFRQLFNSYYKQVGGHPYRGARGLMSRPSLDEVHAYRRGVDEAMLALIERAGDPVLALVELGLNHEQQHQELILTDIKHALWSSPMRPAYRARPAQLSSPATQVPDPWDTRSYIWQEFKGGIHQIGHAGQGFAFDNEGPRHEVLLRPFRIASRAVTSGEWLEFMADGGYRNPALWLSDGWDAICAQNWEAPLYWERRDKEWWQCTMSGTRRVEESEPVCHVSYYEADAYARWAGARLPLEAEWEIAADRNPSRGTMLEDEVFHPRRTRVADSSHALQQMFGDVWEWTASPYVAYPGFRPAPGALGEYNGKFMCNQFVLRGGSCATPSGHIRATYRNFFPPQARWQFSGVRLASDSD
ncbi:MAG: ergothioneine biosynthesis protein EgtB [Acidobacteriia bacterium]|nr:ergothioneine biosynthesis protein EgtB [Terriglobia bacterium]